MGREMEAIADRCAEALVELTDEDREANFNTARQFLSDCGFAIEGADNNWSITEDGILALQYLLCLYGSRVEDLRKMTSIASTEQYTARDADYALAMKKAGVTSADIRVAVAADRGEVVTV